MWTLLALLPLLPTLLTSEVPTNIIHKYITEHSNFSVDPCDDFYAHVCPKDTPGMFFAELETAKMNLVKKYLDEHPELHRFKGARPVEEKLAILWGLINSDDVFKMEPSMLRVFSRFLMTIRDPEELENFKYMDDEKLVEQLRGNIGVLQNYNSARQHFDRIFAGSAVHIQLEAANSKLRHLFDDIKEGVRNAIKKTPWAQKNQVVNLYIEALDKIKFATWADIFVAAHDALNLFNEKMIECENAIYGKFASDVSDAICDVISIGIFKRAVKKPSDNIHLESLPGHQQDYLNAENLLDEYIYMSNAFILLANTDLNADIYGSVGFSLAHEVMHTFVFDERDRDLHNKLMPFWTKTSGCVTEQGLKTCETFEMDCNNAATFEEDAADLTSYRIMWDMYSRGYATKSVVASVEQLDKNQRFFYGAAVMFCQKGASQKGQRGGDQYHSSSYQRVNSLMSQMDEFAEAFQCKPTDRMVRNKATHCELYGKGAPMTRKGYDENYV